MGLWKPKEVAGRRRQLILQLRVFSPGCRRELERGTLSFWAMSWWNVWWHLSIWESLAMPGFGLSLETKGAPQHLRRPASSGGDGWRSTSGPRHHWPHVLGVECAPRDIAWRGTEERRTPEALILKLDLQVWATTCFTCSISFSDLLSLLGSSVSKDSASSTGDRVWSLGWEDPLQKEWQPTPVFLSRKSHRQRSLVSYSPWGHESQAWPSN